MVTGQMASYLLPIVMLLVALPSQVYSDCVHLLTESSGVINLSFEVSSLLSAQNRSVLCTWTILTRNNEVVHLKINEILLSSVSRLDINKTTHGENTLVTELGSNSNTSDLWITTMGDMVIMYSSPNDTDCCTADRFNISYEIVTMCAECVHEQIVNATDFPVNIPNNGVGRIDQTIGCKWLIKTTKGNTLDLSLASLGTAKDIILNIFDGDSNNSSTLYNSSSDPDNDQRLKSSQENMLIDWTLKENRSVIPTLNFIANSRTSVLDCEFTRSLCEWEAMDGIDSTWGLGEMDDKHVVEMLHQKGLRGSRNVLMSPDFSTGDSKLCVTFGYYMDGPVSYSLLFRFFYHNSSHLKLWSGHGSQGTDWNRGGFEIPAGSEGYVVVDSFEGYDTSGEVMIDYIRSSRDTCLEDNAFSCDFEKSFCGWTQDLSDLENWQREKLRVSPFTKEKQTMIHVPLTTDINTKARLISPVLPPFEQGACIELLHRGGGVLSVFGVTSENRILLKQHSSGDLHPSKSNIALNSSAVTNIILEGSSYTGEHPLNGSTAVLKINLNQPYCSAECTFNSEICAWIPSGQVLPEENGVSMTHGVNSSLDTELHSPVIYNLNETYFCFNYSVDRSISMQLELLFKTYGVSAENIISVWKQIGAKDESGGFIRECVNLPSERPFSIIFRNHMLEKSLDGKDTGTIKLSDVAMSSERPSTLGLNCPFKGTFCGWHQPQPSEITWMLLENSVGILASRIGNNFSNDVPGVIYTPTLYRNSSETVNCLQFFYSVSASEQTEPLNGKNASKIEVFLLRSPTDDSSVNDLTPVWRQAITSLISSPTKVTITLDTVSDSFQIAFSARLYAFNVALHTFSLADEHCAYYFNCEFSEGYCGWTKNTTSDAYTWTWGTEVIKDKRKTGPEMGTDLQEGRYTYTNSSLDGTAATLISPIISQHPGEVMCFTFCYYMFGTDVDRLELYKLKSDNSSELLWSKAGNQGSLWYNVEIPIDSSSSVQVAFTSYRKGTLGDIALDSLKAYYNDTCVLQETSINDDDLEMKTPEKTES